MTGLVVARPAVLGEDPGLLRLSDPGGLVLTLGWLLTAIGWAAWRLWSGRGTRLGGVVEAALLPLVVLLFVSAETTGGYRHPARILAWEALGLFLTFFLVRQLAADEPETWQGLFAVLLAGAVSLSAYAVYQVAVEFPALRTRSPEELRHKLARDNPGGAATLADIERRLQVSQASATFGDPNGFAAHLALLLPGLVGAALLSRREGAPRWQIGLAFCCVALAVADLILTRSLPAILAVLAVGFVTAAAAGRQMARRPRVAALLGLLLLAAATWALARATMLDWPGERGAPLLQRWQTAGRMIANHPWLGVGPGNFGRAYPRYVPEQAVEMVRDPHDFALEVCAVGGVFALLALLTALGAFFVQTIRFARSAEEKVAPAPSEETAAEETLPPLPVPVVRWEFYAGGMFGLLLGFVLRVAWRPQEDVAPEAVAAGVRSVVWFAAFALFERIHWPGRAGVVALAAGVAALLLDLCVSEGIGFPSVVGPLCAVGGLALAGLPSPLGGEGSGGRGGPSPSPPTPLPRGERGAEHSSSRLLLAAPLPVAVVLMLIYSSYLFDPVFSSSRKMLQVFRYANALGVEQEPGRNRDPRKMADLIRKHAIGPLTQAAEEDPDNAQVRTYLAQWYGQMWALMRDGSLGLEAVRSAEAAEKFDPDGPAAYQTEYRWRIEFARRARRTAGALRKQQRPGAPEAAGTWEAAAREQFGYAADALARYVPHDPCNAEVRYRLAAALREAGNTPEARKQAERTLELDAVQQEAARNRSTSRTLTDRQRTQLKEWLAPPKGG